MPSSSPLLCIALSFLSLLLAIHAHPYPYRYHYKKIRNPRTSLFPIVVRPHFPEPDVPPPAKLQKNIPPPFQPHLSSHLQTVHSPLPVTADGSRAFPTSAFYPLNFTLSKSSLRKANRTSASHPNITSSVLNSTVKAATHGRPHFLNNALQLFTVHRLHRILSTLTSVRPLIHRRSISSLDDVSVEVLHNVTVSDFIDILSNASHVQPPHSSTSNHTTAHVPSTAQPFNHTHMSSHVQPRAIDDTTRTSFNSQPHVTSSPSTPMASHIASSNPATTVRHQDPHSHSHSFQAEQKLHSLLSSLAASLDALGYTPGTAMPGTSLASRLQIRNDSSYNEPERFRHLQRSVVALYQYITGRSKFKSRRASNRPSSYGAHHRSNRKDVVKTNASSNALRVKSAFSENAEESDVDNITDVEDENEEGVPCDEEPASAQFATVETTSPTASPYPEVKEAAPPAVQSEEHGTAQPDGDAMVSPMSTTSPSPTPSETSEINIPPMAVPMSLDSAKNTEIAEGIDGLRDGENVTQLAQMVYKVAREANVFSMAAAPCDEVTDWMPNVVRKLQSELVGLQFYCIDTREPAQDMGTLRQVFGDVSSAILQASVKDIKDTIPKDLDMVVSWKGLQRWGLDKGWHFMRGVRDSGAKYVLVSNNPRISNLEESTDAVNVRRSPLLFGEPRRIISGITPDSSTELLLYAMDEVRDGF